MAVRIWTVIMLTVMGIFVFTGCEFINSSGVISNNSEHPVDVLSEPLEGNNGVPVVQDSAEEDQIEPPENQDQESPEEASGDYEQKEPPTPKGSFVLGEFYSENNDYKFKVWAWYDRDKQKLMADFLFFDIEKGNIIKVIRSELADSRRTNRKSPVIWLDEKRALLNGLILFKVDDYKSYDLQSADLLEVWDYDVNSSNSALAVLGSIKEGVGVWLIDLDTLYKLPVYSYPLESPWLMKEDFRISWGPDNNIYFDVDYHGRPTIFRYQTIEDKAEAYLYDATLLAVDEKTGEITYAELSGDSQAPPQEKTANLAEMPQKTENQIVLEMAANYLESTGRPVGNNVDKVVITVEKVFNNKAIVAFGPWASEYSGVLILEKKDDRWELNCEKFRHYFNTIYYQEAIEKLSSTEGYEFGEEPGKYVIGSPYETDGKIIFLVSPYGEPWEMQYTLEKDSAGWEITEKLKLQGKVVLPTVEEYPADVLASFLKAVQNKDFDLAKSFLLQTEMEKSLNDLEIKQFELGETRIFADEEKAIVQYWFFSEIVEDEVEYGWWQLARTSEKNWKIII